jgi:hypothetical protein
MRSATNVSANTAQAQFVGENEPRRALQMLEDLVELVGIEPTTSSLRTMRSPS